MAALEMAALDVRVPMTRRFVAMSGVVWINERQAMVATMSHDRRITTCEITRGSMPEPSYLAQAVRVIGDRQRVVILGPSSIRLALEREYVAQFQRPDRLVDVEWAPAPHLQDLVERLRTLAD
jgi:hypothetical protein